MPNKKNSRMAALSKELTKDLRGKPLLAAEKRLGKALKKSDTLYHIYEALGLGAHSFQKKYIITLKDGLIDNIKVTEKFIGCVIVE